MIKSDRFSAFFFILLSLFVCQQSVALGLGTLGRPGPGLLTFGAGAGIGLLALGLLMQSIFSKEGQREIADNERTLQKGRLLLVCLSLFGYTIVVNWLGFFLSTFGFVLFLLRIIESGRWWRMLMKAALITFGNYLIFEVWLGLNLPKGFFAW